MKSGAVLLDGSEGVAAGIAAAAEEEVADEVAGGGDKSAALAEGRMSMARRAWLDLRGELGEILGADLEPDVRGEGAAATWLSRNGRCRKGRRGQVRLRLRLERDTLLEFRAPERLFHGQRAGDFFEFLCRHFLAVWAPAMLTEVKYAHVYRRDGFQCSSPVCSRHDVQPHHLTFRSHGGGEEDENLTSLCTWCHLEGVHGGRIRVRPPASHIHWLLGADGWLVIRGREKIDTSGRRGAVGISSDTLQGPCP